MAKRLLWSEFYDSVYIRVQLTMSVSEEVYVARSSVAGDLNQPGLPAREGIRPTVISARRGWFDWRLNDLWRYRDLVWLFVWRDFVSVYKQTILGPVWHIIQPLMATLVFTFVFGRMAGMSTNGVPPFLFYMTGYVPWMYFATCLDNTSKTFINNSGLLGKVYFHRLVIPASAVISGVIAFAIQLGVLVLAIPVFVMNGAQVHPTAWILATPLLLIMLAGYGLGAGILVCAMTTKYRDLKHLVTFGLQLFMYVTPVIYSVSAVPHAYRWIATMNPLTPIIEGFRLAFLGVGAVHATDLAWSFLLMLGLIGLALTLFTRAERTFMDTV
jgi:lipopolysaccharide transport system permease protein